MFRKSMFALLVGTLPLAVMAHHLPEDDVGAHGASMTSTESTTSAASTTSTKPAASAPSAGHGIPATGAAPPTGHAGSDAVPHAPGDATDRALAQGRAEQLTVQGCWIRAMPAQVPSAGYFTVSNAGRTPAKLTGIVVPGYGMAMLHQTQKAGGMAKMTMAHEIDVPPKGELAFAPGGYHAMLEKPSDQIKVGTLLPVAFQFASGAQVNASCKVLPASALGPD